MAQEKPTGTPQDETSWLQSGRTRIYLVRRRLATGAAALLALAIGYHVIFGHNGLTVYEQKRQTTQELSQELRMLHQENDRLKEHVDRLQSDPDAIEHQARQELHYTRPGEVIYTLPEPAHHTTRSGN